MMLNQGKVAALIPTLGLFGVSAFRLLPSMNRVLSSIQDVRFAMPVVDIMCTELSQINVSENNNLQVSNAIFSKIEIKNISYKYPKTDAMVLDGININLLKGMSIGIIGASGAGKSTLIDLMLGLLVPSEGRIMIDGNDIQEDVRGWQNKIGYVPQDIYLTDDTLLNNIAFGIPSKDISYESIDKAVKYAQLQQLISDLPLGLNTSVGERGVRLSGGQKQRIAIARALYHDPSILMLDEATSALDSATEMSVMAIMKTLYKEKTIVIVAHRMSTIKECDYVYRLKDGRIVAEGTPDIILK